MRGRAIIVHSLDHAKAALSAAAELGVPVTLLSAPGAAAYLGAAVFREMIAEASRVHPRVALTAVLDCGDNPGLALNALRRGVKVVRLEAPADVRSRVADIAAQSGAALDDGGDGALDLLDTVDFRGACLAWLAAAGPA